MNVKYSRRGLAIFPAYHPGRRIAVIFVYWADRTMFSAGIEHNSNGISVYHFGPIVVCWAR